MAKRILFSGGLAAFLVYCYFYVATNAPASVPGELSGVTWTRLLIILLEFTLIINIFKIIKETPKAERNLGSITKANYKGLFTNKLFLGVALLFIYSLVLDYTGFLLGSILFSFAYIWLLGEKRIPRMIVYSVLITVVLYFLFQLGLDIRLPRGVGPLRDFALMLETI